MARFRTNVKTIDECRQTFDIIAREIDMRPERVVVPFSFDLTKVWNGAVVNWWAFACDRDYTVRGVTEIHSVATATATTHTVRARKILSAATSAPGAAAGANVVELSSDTFDLKATANVLRSATLSTTATDLQLSDGDKIGLLFTQTGAAPTALTGGLIVLELEPR